MIRHCNPQIMLLPCSGGRPGGQSSNRAAVESADKGFGGMGCLAGMGAGQSAAVFRLQKMLKISRIP
jgi:uncharacterized metal-binding protein